MAMVQARAGVAIDPQAVIALLYVYMRMVGVYKAVYDNRMLHIIMNYDMKFLAL
jgi:hypothetical protein